MRQSLTDASPHARFPSPAPFGEPPLRMRPQDVHAALSLSPFFINFVQLADPPDSESAARLVESGFRQVPTAIHDLMELSGFSGFDAYLSSFRKKTRYNLRQKLLRVQEAGAECSIEPLRRLSAAELGEIHAKVHVLASAARNINTYGTTFVDGFYSIMQHYADDGYALRLRVQGDLVGAAVFTVRPSFRAEQEGLWRWRRELRSDERTCEMVLCMSYVDPRSSIPPEVGSSCTTVLWLETIRWAIERRLPLFSGGHDPSTGLHFWNYLAVLAFKKRLGMTAATFWSHGAPTFARVPSGLFFAARQAMRLIFWSPVLEREVHRHIALGPLQPGDVDRMLAESHVLHEVLFASPRDQRSSQALLRAADNIECNLWSLRAELGLA